MPGVNLNSLGPVAAALAGLALLLGWAGSAAAQSSAPLDTAWVTDGQVRALAYGNGSLYLGGTFKSVGPSTGSGVALPLGDVKPISGWPQLAGVVNAAEPDGSGGWFIAGRFAIDGRSRAVAHVLADGRVDPGFDVQADGDVNDLLLAGGTLYLGGSFGGINGGTNRALAAVDATTGNSTGFGVFWTAPLGQAVEVNALALQGNTVIVGGVFEIQYSEPVNGQLVQRVHRNLAGFDAGSGALVRSFRHTFNGRVRALAQTPNRLYVGGDFTTINGSTFRHLAAVFTDSGSIWAWTPNPDGPVHALGVSGTTIFAGGAFGQVGVSGQNLTARSRLAAWVEGDSTATSWNPGADGTVRSLYRTGTSLFVGGDFASVGGLERHHAGEVSTLSGSVTTWEPNPNGPVSAWAISGSSLFIGGSFNSVGAVRRSNLAAIDLATGRATSFNPGADGAVRTLWLDGGTLYAGGDFAAIGGKQRRHVAAIDTATAGATDWTPQLPATPIVSVVAGSDETVFVGGNFRVGDQNTGLLALDRSTGQPSAGPVVGGPVDALLVRGGTLYIGGWFTQALGQPRKHLAAVDVELTQLEPFAPDLDDSVRALAFRDGELIAGGNFQKVGAADRHGVAAFDPSGSGTPAAWTAGTPPSTVVWALAPDAPHLFLAGSFQSLGGLPRDRAGGVDAAGAPLAWSPARWGASEWPRVLLVAGEHLVAAGDFATVDGRPRQGIAIFPFNSIPTVATADAVDVARTSATLRAEVDANGRRTAIRFQYGTSTGYGTTSPAQDAGARSDAVSIGMPVSGLQPGTTYHYRAEILRNGATVAFGEDRTFTTAPEPPSPGPDPGSGSGSGGGTTSTTGGNGTSTSTTGGTGTGTGGGGGAVSIEDLPAGGRVGSTGRVTFLIELSPGTSGQYALTARVPVRRGSARKRRVTLDRGTFPSDADGEVRIRLEIPKAILRRLGRARTLTATLTIRAGGASRTERVLLRLPRRA